MDAQNTVGPIFKWVAREDDPKANNKIILAHVAFKGAQTGSIAITLFQLLYYRRRVRVASFFRGNFAATLSTSFASTVGAYYMVKTSDPIKNYDRAFRIQHNSVQNRCDKYSVMFAGGFAFMSIFFWPVPLWQGWVTYEKMLGFICFGFGQGAFSHYITKNGPHHLELINMWMN